jgi:hypothetical protein
MESSLSAQLQELEEARSKSLICEAEFTASRNAVLRKFEGAACASAWNGTSGRANSLDTFVATNRAAGLLCSGYERDLTLEAAMRLADERNAVGIFQSNIGQFHWLYPGGNEYDVRVDKEKGYNVTGLWVRLHTLFRSVPSVSDARWSPEDGFERNLSLPEAMTLALEKNAIGFFQSNPNQYHWLHGGTRRFEVRVGPEDYNVTSLWVKHPPLKYPSPENKDS